MQRVAQDWLVLTQRTHHDASAVGIVMALQFAPQLLLLPWTGFAADHLNQRKLLMVTQATMRIVGAGFGNPYDHGQRPSLAGLCICVFVWLGGCI
jgi:MFS family permease